mmetsp:Transcript_75272/g.233532  ORF Transcript_75272/g.233532 Transcript_75272/m.233532 type:complete len:403 (+) Transcript_75272:61-1269(+)
MTATMVCTMAPAATEATTKMHHVKADSGAGQPEPVHHPIQEPAAARPGAAAAQLVRQPPCWRPVDDFEATLGDYADCMLQACHAQSQRHLPCAASVALHIHKADRDSILNWLVLTCEIMRFHETVLYTSVLTLDRYSALAGECLSMESIQRVLMAIMCTVLKTSAVQDHVCGTMPLRELLAHLFRQQARLSEIFATERQVLRTLDFMVTAPSALDFLDALSVPLAAAPAAGQDGCPPRSLANFLLQLSLFSAAVHYSYPHAILAASAVYIAICSLQAAPSTAVRTLLEDTCVACPDIPDVPSRVATCALALHGLWIDFATSHGTSVPSLLRKFGGPRLLANVLFSPPLLGALPHPGSFVAATSSKASRPPWVDIHEAPWSQAPPKLGRGTAESPGVVVHRYA